MGWFSTDAVGEETLTFRLDEGLVLVDHLTRSRWQGMEGVAVRGPLGGERLERVPSTRAFWFGWRDYHAATAVWGEAGDG